MINQLNILPKILKKYKFNTVVRRTFVSFNRCNNFLCLKKDYYNIIKRFSGRDKLPEILKKASDTASTKITPSINNNNAVTPKSPTEFLRETSLQKDSLTSKESFHDQDKKDFPSDKTSSLKPLDKIDSIQEKVKASNIQTPSNDIGNSQYKGFYIDNQYHIINIKGETVGTVNDPDHVIVAREGPNKSLLLDGRTTSDKRGIPEGEMRNVRLSSDKIDGSHTPKDKGSMKSGIDNDGNFIPYRKSNEFLQDDFGNTVPHPEKGGQRYQQYPYPHIVNADERENLSMHENKQATEYLNRPDVKSILDSVHSLREGADPVIALSQESLEEVTFQEEGISTTNDSFEDAGDIET